MEWYLKALKQYADFQGRARRKEYWMYTLFNIIALGICIGIDSVIGIPALMVIYVLGTIIPSIAVTVRRMHDIDRSGWMILIQLIPLIGGLWFLILSVTEGTQGANRFGEDPKEGE